MADTQVFIDGLVIGESTRWHDGRLWLSDWGARQILAVDLDGTREVVLELPKYPFSFDFLSDGRLVVVSGGERKLLRREHDSSITTVADLSEIADFAWNEIVVDAEDNAFVNSIGFEFGSEPPPAPGVLAFVTAEGKVRQVAGELEFPNGMIMTPDGSTLIVAESFASRLTAFVVGDDGELSNRRVWAQLEEGGDGICTDAEGAVWTPAFRRCLRVAEGGEVLDAVELDRESFACMLGGADGRTLFIAQAKWRGPEHMFDEPHTGQVVTFDAPAAHAGRP